MSVSQILSGTPAGANVPSVTTSEVSAPGSLNLTAETGIFRVELSGNGSSNGAGSSISMIPNGPNSSYWTQFATGGPSFGGVIQDAYQHYGYDGPLTRQYLQHIPVAQTAAFSDDCGITLLNPNLLDNTRTGTFTGTGVAQNVNVNSIIAGDSVLLWPIAGPAFPAAAPAAPVITPSIGAGVSGFFTVTAPLNVVYRYLVL